MTEPDAERLLRYLLAQYERLLVVHENVNMDTPEDRDLHARAVAQFRRASKPVLEFLYPGTTP